jgi:hypothetical protein
MTRQGCGRREKWPEQIHRRRYREADIRIGRHFGDRTSEHEDGISDTHPAIAKWSGSIL